MVVIEEAAEDEEIDERRAEEQLLQSPQRTKPDQVAHPAGQVVAHRELEIDVADVFADYLDLLGTADTQPGIVGELDIGDAHRIEAHHLGRDGVDGDLIVGGQYIVLLYRNHGSRPRTIAGGS